MFAKLLPFVALGMINAVARSQENSADSAAYPIQISANNVHEFSTLAIDMANLKLSGESMIVIPISTEVGITGAVLIGNGKYSYTPEKGRSFNGRFHAGMLRFNPKDADAILKLNTATKSVDKGASELAKALLAAIFRHCYHSGDQALLPPEQAIAADLFSRELGEVLFSASGQTNVVYNFTSRRMIYEKK